MARDETTDIAAAFLIGAVLGIGATLLLHESDARDAKKLVRRLQRKPGVPGRAVARARGAGDELATVGRRAAAALRDDASDIIAAARSEIRSLAREGIRLVRARSRR